MLLILCLVTVYLSELESPTPFAVRCFMFLFVVCRRSRGLRAANSSAYFLYSRKEKEELRERWRDSI